MKTRIIVEFVVETQDKGVTDKAVLAAVKDFIKDDDFEYEIRNATAGRGILVDVMSVSARIA